MLMVTFDLEMSKSAPTNLPISTSFRTLFENEFTYVLNTLRRLGVHERDLEDVTHDVFVSIYLRLAEYDPSRPIKPWLFGTAFRIASDYRKRARHRRELLHDTDPLEPVALDEGAEGELLLKEQRELVIAGLELMDMDRRAVLIMHDIDGFTMPEIASTLSIPLNTAYSRLRLGRDDFRAAIVRIRKRKENHAKRGS